MNLLQMLYCAFFVKGGQLADDYLHTAYGIVQGYRQLRQYNWRLRNRGVQDTPISVSFADSNIQITAENVDNAVGSILSETVSTGTSMCSCDKISLPATASTTETKDSQ